MGENEQIWLWEEIDGSHLFFAYFLVMMSQRSGCPSHAWYCCANMNQHCVGAVTVTTRCIRAWWRSSSQTYWDPYPVSQLLNSHLSLQYQSHLIVLVLIELLRYQHLISHNTMLPTHEVMIWNYSNLDVIYDLMKRNCSVLGALLIFEHWETHTSFPLFTFLISQGVLQRILGWFLTTMLIGAALRTRTSHPHG